jgi:predicted SnoaL-like aldol condensation-catalyzing enzyme
MRLFDHNRSSRGRDMKKVAIIAAVLATASMATPSAHLAVPQQVSYAMNGQEQRNLQLVHDFWRDIMEGGNRDIAAHYMTEDFVSWNPNVAAGRDAFVSTLRTRPDLIQNARVEGLDHAEVQFADGPYVFIMWANYVNDIIEPAHIYKYNTLDLFRIENGKIVEHWDGARKVVDTDFGAKSDGGGTFENSMNLSELEQDTHRIGQVEFRDILQFNHTELAEQYFHPNYMQHNPNVPGGLANFMVNFGGREQRELTGEWITPPTLEIVSGNFYLKFDQRMEDDPAGGQSAYYRFDMVRVDDGLIWEHWDVAYPNGTDSTPWSDNPR